LGQSSYTLTLYNTDIAANWTNNIVYNEFPNYIENSAAINNHTYWFESKDTENKFIIHKHLPSTTEYDASISF